MTQAAESYAESGNLLVQRNEGLDTYGLESGAQRFGVKTLSVQRNAEARSVYSAK